MLRGVSPPSLEEQLGKPDRVLNEIVTQAHETIRNYFGEGFGSVVKTKAMIKDLSESPLSMQVRELILVGLALRLSREEIEQQVKMALGPEAKVIDASGSLVYVYKRKFRDVIDELYSVVATQTGDVYKYADKLYRIYRLNMLSDAVDKQLLPRVQMGDLSDETFKLGNLFVKLMEKINYEMGNQNLGKMVRYSPRDGKKTPTKEDVQEYWKNKFGGQLPEGIVVGIEGEIKKVDNGTNE